MVGETRAVTNAIHTINAAAEPTAPSALAEAFYAEALRELSKLGLPFLLAGTYALSAYTGITRATKDLDILCKPSDYPRILDRFKNLGYAIEIEDERWIAKIFCGEHFFDVIFASWHGVMCERSMVRARTACRGVRHTGACRRTDRADLVQGLRPTATSLRWRGHRAPHTQTA